MAAVTPMVCHMTAVLACHARALPCFAILCHALHSQAAQARTYTPAATAQLLHDVMLTSVYFPPGRTPSTPPHSCTQAALSALNQSTV